MRRVPPSMLVREELDRLLHGGDRRGNQHRVGARRHRDATRRAAVARGRAGRFSGRPGPLRAPRGRSARLAQRLRARAHQAAPKERSRSGSPRSVSRRALPLEPHELPRRQLRRPRPPRHRDVRPGAFDPRRRGRLSGRHRRAAHLQVRGLRDHRPALGGLPGLHRPGPVGDLRRVPVLRRRLRVAPPPGRQRGPTRRLVHRLGGQKAPFAPGRRQQGVRGRLDRVLPQHVDARACGFPPRSRPTGRRG